jgi:sugar phosphate isomerase/epimerase
MRSAITISQVPEAAGGPFVLRGSLREAIASAAACGFDAVELFLPGPDFVDPAEVLELAAGHGVSIAAVGTGAGALCHGLTLLDPDPLLREQAVEFLLRMVGFGGRLGAPAILGSVQGRQAAGMERAEALDIMAAALERCSAAAADWGVAFIYEPLNRYETNVFNQLEKAAEFLAERGLERVCLLADLFHMNIEERDIAAALRGAGMWVGHVHFADSNRQAMGFGHTDPVPVLAALREIGYQGYLSAEILPLPDPLTAARQTIESIRAALAACPE